VGHQANAQSAHRAGQNSALFQARQKIGRRESRFGDVEYDNVRLDRLGIQANTFRHQLGIGIVFGQVTERPL